MPCPGSSVPMDFQDVEYFLTQYTVFWYKYY